MKSSINIITGCFILFIILVKVFILSSNEYSEQSLFNQVRLRNYTYDSQFKINIADTSTKNLDEMVLPFLFYLYSKSEVVFNKDDQSFYLYNTFMDIEVVYESNEKLNFREIHLSPKGKKYCNNKE